MLCYQVPTLVDDLVDVLHDLELLVAIVPIQPHAFTNHLKDIDDAEWPIALVCTQFAMIGMVNRNQGVHTRGTSRFEFPQLQLTLELRKRTDMHALQTYSGLVQIDKRDARDHLKAFGGGLHDARDARMLVQRDAHLDPALQMRL